MSKYKPLLFLLKTVVGGIGVVVVVVVVVVVANVVGSVGRGISGNEKANKHVLLINNKYFYQENFSIAKNLSVEKSRSILFHSEMVIGIHFHIQSGPCSNM